MCASQAPTPASAASPSVVHSTALSSAAANAPKDYHYLNQSGVDAVESIDDSHDYHTTVEALETMGVDTDVRKNMFQLLFGVLHLGNVLFEIDEQDQGEKCTCSNRTAHDMTVVCSLLGFQYRYSHVCL